VNTSAFAVGDILYASPTVAGGFTTTKPIAPNNIISVAAVLSSGANGILLIRPQIGSNINNDEGVKITTPTTGDILQLQASGLWENKSRLAAGLITGSGTLNRLAKFTAGGTVGNSGIFESGGNVGIGTTSPSVNLHVSNTGGTCEIRNTGGTSSFKVITGTGFSSIGTITSDPLVFVTADTERMRITSGGNLLINTDTDAGFRLDVNGTGRFSGNLTASGLILGAVGQLVTAGGNTFLDYTGNLNIRRDFGALTALTLTSTGAATFSSSVTATGFFVSSSIKLKDVINRDGDVAYFKWKNKQDDLVHIGYIAEEVQEKNSDQVSLSGDYLSVNYVEILVEKVRFLEKRVFELEKLK
jgi:uncharacterized protein YaiE (UPF0345 family)